MRIAIIATGSRGDVQPYIALGTGLQRAGHTVRLVSHQNYQALVSDQGLDFWPVEGDVADVAQSPEMRRRLERGNFLAILSQMAKEAQRGALLLAEASLEACRGMDLIVAGLGGVYVGLALAEKLGLSVLEAYLIPFSPTRAFPSVLLPRQLPGMGGALNRLSHHLTRQIMWQSFRSADRLARRQVLDLPPAPFWGPAQARGSRKYPVLFGFSPAVIPPPDDWLPTIRVTGYWFLDAAEGWSPPETLENFLQAGPPPVYIGFGSMSNRRPEEVVDLILQALDRTHQRAVMMSGWSGLQKANLPESVFMVDSLPHDWLFPRMAAVVHHGGAGTTAAGLRAGVPSIVIPFFGDQPFWGQRVADLGVGPAPIPRRSLTVDRLGEAIHAAVTDQAMRAKAAALGKRIQTEDGVANAVAIITNTVG